MIAFRLRLPKVFSSSLPIAIRPFLFLLFVYFLTSSADLLHVYLLIFKIKLTNGIAFLLFVCTFLFFRTIQIPRKFLLLTLAILGCMGLSTLNSPNLIASAGFIVFFIFNFLVYFVVSYNQFRLFDSDTLLKVYSLGFYCTGLYAFCQIIFSFGGIILPGVKQYIDIMARGQAFAYEPSYYALYMTPFAFFCTAKFLLQNRSERKVRDLFWPNFFLLASTSTGCFFSYLFFFFFLIIFHYLKICSLPLKKLFLKFSIVFGAVFALLMITYKELILSGFLKFFYKGGVSHFSVYDRWRGLKEYWNIFLEHPMTGVSFGGGPFYLAQQKGTGNQVDVLDPAILSSNILSPANATTEVMASVGILGSICFLCFFYFLVDIFRSALRIQNLMEKERITLIAFALSICIMLMTLQFNQSIMRPYLWIHIGIFCGYARSLKEKYQPKEIRPPFLYDSQQNPLPESPLPSKG